MPAPEDVRAVRYGWFGAGVFVVSALFYALLAAPVPFYSKGEAREALTVQAILDGYGVVLPRRDGEEMTAKPPLFHWMAALAVRAGVRPEELAVRLPSVVLGAATVAAIAVVAAGAYGVAAGLLAAAVTGTAFEFLRAATLARVDMTLAAAIVAAVLAWHAGLARADGRALVRAGWVAAAAGVLAKGPVGVVLPLLIVAAAAAAERDLARLRRLADLPGVVLAAGIVGAWWAAAWAVAGGEFVARQLVHENVARALGGRGAAHVHPVWFYVPALAGSFFPWTLALPLAAVRAWRRPQPADRFFVAWAATVFVFYSLAAGKRAVYLLPLVPPLGALTASALAEWAALPRGRAARAALAAGAAVALVVAAVVVAGGERAAGDALAPVLHARDRENLPLVLGIVGERRAAIALVLGALAAGLLLLRARSRRPVAALVGLGAVWGVGLMALGTYPLALASTQRPFAEAVRGMIGPDDRLCSAGPPDYGLRYYLRRRVPACGGRVPDDGRRRFVIRQYDGRRSAGGRCGAPRVVDDRPAGAGLRFALAECPGAGDAP